MRHIRYATLLPLLCLVGVLGAAAPAKACDDGYALYAGTRVCDVTNRDGYCIKWHSSLRDAVFAPGTRCDAWSCDLTGQNRRVRARRRHVEQPIEVTPIEPRVLEFDADHPFDDGVNRLPQ